MSFIARNLTAWRTGGVTGAGFTENNIKMLIALITPFLIGWAGVRFFAPPEIYDTYIGLLCIGWFLWCILLFAWAKSDAGNYVVMAQSKWRFPDGTCKVFDLKIPPDSWIKLCTFENGDVGYKVFFQDKYFVELSDLPFPLIFDSAYWILPDLWDKTFQKRSEGEFFHKGVYVTKPDCEDISCYVTHYEPTELGNVPVAIINDSSLVYQETLRNAKRMSIGKVALLNSKILALEDEKRQRLALETHTSFLEDRVEIAEKEASKDFKTSADERMKMTRRRHARIMSVREPLLTRIFNLKNLAIVIGLAVIVFVFGRIFFGLW